MTWNVLPAAPWASPSFTRRERVAQARAPAAVGLAVPVAGAGLAAGLGAGPAGGGPDGDRLGGRGSRAAAPPAAGGERRGAQEPRRGQESPERGWGWGHRKVLSAQAAP